MIFLSYRRTDGPQACRVCDWLTSRFGADAVFMDVSAIPFAVSFSEFIREAIEQSSVLIALIGADWQARIGEPDDPVRMEIETALENHVPVLPVLIGNTPMPEPEDLPESIAAISAQNAVTVGTLQDFHAHMQVLLPKIESILGAMARYNEAIADPQLVRVACRGIVEFLVDRLRDGGHELLGSFRWEVIGTDEFVTMRPNACTCFLHRVKRLAEVLELHFILSCWGHASDVEHLLAGWLTSELERTPVIPAQYFSDRLSGSDLLLKIRRSDEDARAIWKMVTDQPLRLSLSYVATVRPATTPAER